MSGGLARVSQERYSRAKSGEKQRRKVRRDIAEESQEIYSRGKPGGIAQKCQEG